MSVGLYSRHIKPPKSFLVWKHFDIIKKKIKQGVSPIEFDLFFIFMINMIKAHKLYVHFKHFDYCLIV